MSRTITLIAAVGAALAVAVPSALGKGQPVEPQWMQALEARSQELNRHYGLGEYASTVTKSIDARERSMSVGRDEQPTSVLDARERAFATKRNVQLSTGTPPDAFERAVIAGTGALGAYPASTVRINDALEHPVSAGGERTSMLDARERAFVAKRNVQLANGTPPDAFERAVAARSTGSVDPFIANDNRFRVTPVNDPVSVSATGSGTDIEWPQIGIGLGIGIALMLGLLLGLRATRQPPLAH
jgi:hypothetical protein